MSEVYYVISVGFMNNNHHIYFKKQLFKKTMKKILVVVLIFLSFGFWIPFKTPGVYATLCEQNTCAGYQCGCECGTFTPGCYSTNDCGVGGCCQVTVPAIGTCRFATSSFLPGTLVSTIKGEKKIEDIKIGDRVLSFINDFITQSSVSKVHKTKKDYYYILKAGDYEVKATALHPFYIGNNQFKTVKDLKAGDYVYVLEDVPY